MLKRRPATEYQFGDHGVDIRAVREGDQFDAIEQVGMPNVRRGKPRDAFPSGHAVHIGAVASALSWMNPRAAPVIWLCGGALAGTRIVLLAHWTSDVFAGLTGVGLERALLSKRLFPGRRHVRGR